MTTETKALHYVDPSTVVWCPTVSAWTGDDLGFSIDAGMKQCPECYALLDDADIEPAHHVEIGDQWCCGGEESAIIARYSWEGPSGDQCAGCGDWVIT